MTLSDREKFAAEFAGVLAEHAPCYDFDGCQCEHRTGVDTTYTVRDYGTWIAHVVIHFAMPELATGELAARLAAEAVDPAQIYVADRSAGAVALRLGRAVWGLDRTPVDRITTKIMEGGQ